MMMNKIFTCFLALFGGSVLCQNCDFMVVHQCMQSSNGSADPMAGMKAAMDNCFTSAGCTVPQKPSNAVEQCRKQVQDTIKNDIQTCVQAQFPSFSFPPWNQSLQQQGGWIGRDEHGGGGHSGEKRGDQGFQAILNQSCPDSASAQKVQSCMDNLRSSMKSGSRPGFSKSQMCAKKASCMNQLSSACQTQWTQIKSQLCTCTKNEISTKSAALQAQLQACSSSSTTTVQPAAASVGKGSSKNRGKSGDNRSMGQGKMGRSGERGQGRGGGGDREEGLQKMGEWFCKDPCSNN
uniref:Uncharacterized protein n=1 Tax=Romanomermis culicivorax TaxID=13658 RepID=A0A915HTC7_ROMCU